MCRLVIAVVALAFVGACSGTKSSVVYEPATQATASINGRPAAGYPVPPEAPRGEVNVASLGLVDLSVDQNGGKTRFLQIRMIAANNNDAGPWVIDSREQLLSLPNEGQSRPAFVNTDKQDAPNITVEPAQKRTIDLFYPLPQPLANADSVSQFDLLWHVRTQSREVAERTPFEGVRVDTDNADAYAYGGPYAYDGAYPYDIGWGPVWWYDPFFVGVTFVHPGFVHVPRGFGAHPFVGPGRVHVVGRVGGFHGHPGGFHGHPGGFATRQGGFAGGRPPGTFHAGPGFHGGGGHPGGGGFHGGGGGFHGGGGGFHGGGGGFHGGGGGFHGGGGGGHR